MEHLITNPNTIEQNIIAKSLQLLNQNPLMLYHGNKDKDMIPKYGYGKLNNDYGQGFYAELELYWIGQMYAYSHCLTRLSSKEIYTRLPLQDMRHFFVTGHKMSMNLAFEKISGSPLRAQYNMFFSVN